MSGYHDAPELTAETLDADGWVRTRDLARFDDRATSPSSTGPAT
jgi:long-subunit acyl-CoA synthetase (AMP-forming)